MTNIIDNSSIEDLFDLTKKAGTVLQQRQIATIKSQVKGALDVTGSLKWAYNQGIMQGVVLRTLALALNMDDDGEVDMVAFDDNLVTLPTANKDNIATYIDDNVLNNRKIDWQGTYFAHVVSSVSSSYDNSVLKRKGKNMFGRFFGGKQEPIDPAFVLWYTDGDTFDEDETEAALVKLQSKPIYWQFVGIGTQATFNFVRQLADDLPNVGFSHIPDITQIVDDELYNKLITQEYADWVHQHGLIKS
jgi:hypothetical protein